MSCRQKCRQKFDTLANLSSAMCRQEKGGAPSTYEAGDTLTTLENFGSSMLTTDLRPPRRDAKCRQGFHSSSLAQIPIDFPTVRNAVVNENAGNAAQVPKARSRSPVRRPICDRDSRSIPNGPLAFSFSQPDRLPRRSLNVIRGRLGRLWASGGAARYTASDRCGVEPAPIASPFQPNFPWPGVPSVEGPGRNAACRRDHSSDRSRKPRFAASWRSCPAWQRQDTSVSTPSTHRLAPATARRCAFVWPLRSMNNDYP